ncbi:MAG: YqeG family HAD IIIA-type phosphatase, partial [Oscillospiraceae bacterium]|nr:YqeG family HAD IIIA-type phosphatase [Oscillospiraceae bacterium]
NTLTTHDNPVPNERVLAWLDDMRAKGFSLVIVSNNNEARVSEFAKTLDLPFVYHAQKPRRGGLLNAAKNMGLNPSEVAVIGDQIFTDILGANRAQMISILVVPFYIESMIFFKIKRILEKPFIKSYKNRLKRSNV